MQTINDVILHLREMQGQIKVLTDEVFALRAEVHQLRNPTVPVRGQVEGRTIKWWGSERKLTSDV